MKLVIVAFAAAVGIAALTSSAPASVGKGGLDIGQSTSGPTSNPLSMCGNSRTATSAVEAFARGLRDITLSMDQMPRAQVMLGLDAIAELELQAAAYAPALCPVLADAEQRGFDMEAAQMATRRGVSLTGCLDPEPYVSLLTVKTIIDQAAAVAQGFCDASSCPVFPEPPSCGFSCFPVTALNISSEVLALPLDLSDKCAEQDHEEEMSGMRALTRRELDDARAAVFESLVLASSAQQSSAGEAELVETGASLVEAFDGGDLELPDAVGPSLARLEETVARERIGQRSFEELALATRLEAALSTGVVYSRMQRPVRFDGLLEVIRELVAQRIEDVAASGGEVNSALQAFRSGDQAFNAADFREALNGYRAAYVELGLETEKVSR